MNTTNSLVVVTGAGSGIGWATAERFAREGCAVAALDVSRVGLNKLCEAEWAGPIRPYVTDLNNLEAVTQTADTILTECGPVRVLVNNAAVFYYASITDSTVVQWQTSLTVNLLAPALLARLFVPGMRKAGGGAIVNISSRNALSSSPLSSSYDASKAGLLGLTRTLAVELGKDNIRVNAVCPGVIDTPANREVFNDPKFLHNYRKLIPLDRFGQAAEIANAVFFLASPESSFISGQYLVVDGGQIAGQNYGRIFAGDNWVPGSSDFPANEKQ